MAGAVLVVPQIAAAADAGAVLEAFAACSPSFFAVATANAAAFGSVDVREPQLSDPAQTGVAQFAAPIEARGLHLTGFSQGAPQPPDELSTPVTPGSRSRFYHWGFQATEGPLAVATAITQIAPQAAFRERRATGDFGWIMELEPETTIEPGAGPRRRGPTRILLIRPRGVAGAPASAKPDSGSVIECGVAASLMAGHEVLPKVSATFAKAP